MTNTANILKNVIRNGGMPLSQVAERIETMYLNGRINAEERSELIELMHSKASPENEKGDYKELYDALATKYNDLERRLSALEERMDGGEVPEGDTDAEDDYPAWRPWDGVSTGYQYGDIVTHNEKVWENMLTGMGNVWEPGAPGVDERYWREVV